MRLHPSNGLILAVVAFVFVAAPAYAGPGTPAADANERSATATILGIAMQDANQRASGQSSDVIGRVTDANERLAPRASAPSLEIASDDSGFAWTAVIGASSAFLFALLVGASVILVRYNRRRAFAG
jgi:hypothetical protein